MYVAVRSGLRSASMRLSQMLTTFGARQSEQLLYLDIPSALPSFLSGLKVSITAAMIGTIVGEWFGAPAGLGVVILNTMQNFQIPLMWASVLLVAALSLAGFGLLNLAERWVEWRVT
jgi:NitT/TauT family transport system permease protein